MKLALPELVWFRCDAHGAMFAPGGGRLVLDPVLLAETVDASAPTRVMTWALPGHARMVETVPRLRRCTAAWAKVDRNARKLLDREFGPDRRAIGKLLTARQAEAYRSRLERALEAWTRALWAVDAEREEARRAVFERLGRVAA